MATTKAPTVNGKTFAQASAGITDRTALGNLAKQYQSNSQTTTQSMPGATYKDGNTRNGVLIPDRVANAAGTASYKYGSEEANKILAENIGTKAMDVPPPPVGENYMGTIDGANKSLANPELGTSTDKNGIVTVTPVEQTAQADGGLGDIFKQYQELSNNLQKDAPSAESIYNKSLKESGLRQYQKEAQNYSSQINAITAKAQADILSTTGQGRGIPEAIIGGQQAQISKEAAIQALPLQALLANAQGNVELAQSHLDTLFKIRFEDAKTKHEYKTKLLDSAMQVATKQEQRQYEAIQKADDRKYAEQVKNADQIKSISMSLLTNQAPGSIVQKAASAKTVAEVMAIPGIGKYMQSPLERLQVQKASLDVKKATQELKDIMATSAGDGITTEQRDALVKNPSAIKASSRIGVISAVKQYKDLAAQYYGTGTFGVISPAKRAKLDAMLNTTVGSAINVAQGQGAMGDEEAKRILGGLKITNWNSPRKIQNAADGVITAQDTLYENDINFVESGIPGARAGYQLFADYDRSKTDPLLLVGSSQILNPLNLNL